MTDETDAGREPRTGKFHKGKSGNPHGRPRKARSVGDAILGAANEKVGITENGRRRKVRKIEAVAKQVLNRGAGGDPRSAKLALDYAQKAEDRLTATPPASDHLRAAEEEIVARFVARLTRIIKEEDHGFSEPG